MNNMSYQSAEANDRCEGQLAGDLRLLSLEADQCFLRRGLPRNMRGS
jgi:hypothetical protein